MPNARKTGGKSEPSASRWLWLQLFVVVVVNPYLLPIPPSLDYERSCYLVGKLQTKKINMKDLEELGSPILFLEVCEDIEVPSEKANIM